MSDTANTPVSQPASQLDPQACYSAFRAHDSRFDGRFFIGISSTGIYCRPVCRVKTPKAENCSYFASAAAAEAGGYRPCLRCRPELAPGLSQMEALARTARQAAALMEEEWLAEGSLADLAARLGITDRHLRRAFAAEFGVSPVQYLQTRRLLLAKSLLTDTGLSVTAVAMATGFGSVRRFNDLFKKHYRLTPSRFRKLGDEQPGQDPDRISLFLGYRPPYAWKALIRFLAARALPGVEEIAGGQYRRTLSLPGGGKNHQGWICLQGPPARQADRILLRLTLSSSLLPVLPRLLGRVRHIFDLNSNPAEIYARLQPLNAFVPGLCRPGLRLPGCFNPLEAACAAFLDHPAQVERLLEQFAQPCATPFSGLNRLLPGPARFLQAAPGPGELAARLGCPPQAAAGLIRLAELLAESESGPLSGLAPEACLARLLALPEISSWQAQYLTLRLCGWPNAWPSVWPSAGPDVRPEGGPGVGPVVGPEAGFSPQGNARLQDRLAALPPEAVEAVAPWRAYAALNIWDFLNNNQEG